MKITAITRFKHGGLWSILKRIDWTQSKLAEMCGFSPYVIGDIINLQRRPTVEQANTIQRVLGDAGEFLDVLSEWPETFAGLKRGFNVEHTEDIPLERLIDHPEILQIPEEFPADYSGLSAALESIPARERKALEKVWLEEKTLKESSDEMGYAGGGERARQLSNKALRLLRHPKRIATILEQDYP